MTPPEAAETLGGKLSWIVAVSSAVRGAEEDGGIVICQLVSFSI